MPCPPLPVGLEWKMAKKSGAEFIHVVRPATFTKEFPQQHYFGSNHSCIEKSVGVCTSLVTVMRFTDADQAKVEIAISDCFSTSYTAIKLTADELQVLACALLDAAYALRTQTAADATLQVLTGGAV